MIQAARRRLPNTSELIASRLHPTMRWSHFLRAAFRRTDSLRVDLRIPARFTPGSSRVEDAPFRAIYVGSLTVTKGVPVLLDAFRRLGGDAELVLLGGWATRGNARLPSRLPVV